MGGVSVCAEVRTPDTPSKEMVWNVVDFIKPPQSMNNTDLELEGDPR